MPDGGDSEDAVDGDYVMTQDIPIYKDALLAYSAPPGKTFGLFAVNRTETWTGESEFVATKLKEFGSPGSVCTVETKAVPGVTPGVMSHGGIVVCFQCKLEKQVGPWGNGECSLHT